MIRTFILILAVAATPALAKLPSDPQDNPDKTRLLQSVYSQTQPHYGATAGLCALPRTAFLEMAEPAKPGRLLHASSANLVGVACAEN